MNWIYCTDRLPDHDHDVLVTIGWGDRTAVTVDSYWGDGEWLNNSDVIAWMDLPEPAERR